MGNITFNAVSASAKASKIYVEQEAVNRGTGSPVIQRKILVIGQYDEASKTPTENVAQLVLNLNDAWERYGRGSMLSYLLSTVFKIRGAIPVYAIPIGEHASGVASVGRIAITGTATTDGILNVYIAGKKISVVVSDDDTADDIGEAIEAAINADLDLPVTATNTSGTVDFTVKWKGESGNQIKLEVNKEDGDETPAGILLTLTAIGTTTAGANDPDISNALDALGSIWYTDVVCPYIGSDNLATLKSIGDNRNDPGVNRPIGFFLGYADTAANYLTFLSSINCEWIITVPVHGSSTPAMKIAASICSMWAKWQSATPGKPMRGQIIRDVLAGSLNDLTHVEREAIIAAGGSHTYNQADGTVITGDLVTTRITTDAGAETDDYLFAEFIPNLQFKRYALEQTYLQEPFDNAVLIADGGGRGPSHAVRPSTVKAYAIKLVDDWVLRGLSMNRDTIVAGIIAEINDSNPGRCDLMIPDIMASGLRIIAVKIEWSYITG